MNKKNQIFQMNSDILYNTAANYMKYLCGNIDYECENIGIYLKNIITPQLLYSIYEKECIFKDRVQLEGEQILIDWNDYAGGEIELKKIEKVVIYFLTLKEYTPNEINQNESHYSKTESMLEKFYLDGWENAYLEAARAYSKEYIKKITECEEICDVFAPGIVGISLEQMGKFFTILQGEKIGVTYWRNSMLIPEKTVAGLYFLMKDAKVKYEKSCENCIGKTIGCMYCANEQKKKG